MICMLMHMFGQRHGGGKAADGRRPGARETARAIMDRRYASGEITKDQYDEMRRALQAAGEMR